MSKPKLELPSPEDVLAMVDEEGRLAVRVTPGARCEAMVIESSRLVIKVRAKPQDGKANDAVIHLVAQALGLAPSKVELLRGATSRDKLVRVRL